MELMYPELDDELMYPELDDENELAKVSVTPYHRFQLS